MLLDGLQQRRPLLTVAAAEAYTAHGAMCGAVLVLVLVLQWATEHCNAVLRHYMLLCAAARCCWQYWLHLHLKNLD